jgi:hypothetical protein
MTCLELGRFFAASSPRWGGVTGSMLPEKMSTGTFDETGLRKLFGIFARGHIPQARVC